MAAKKNPMEPTSKDLRKFGIGLFVILGVIGGLLIWRERVTGPYFAGASGLSLILSLAWPQALKPIYRVMMWIGHKLAWVNTYVILTLVFIVIFMPVGLFLRLIGKDLLNQKLEPDRESYWLDRKNPPFDPEAYKQQY